MSSAPDLKIIDHYRGQVLVGGTSHVGVAKQLLDDGATFTDAVVGWYVNVDGHFGLLSDTHLPGTVQGVMFHGVQQCTAHTYR